MYLLPLHRLVVESNSPVAWGVLGESMSKESHARSEVASSDPDVRAIMSEIRAKVSADVEAHRDTLPKFEPKVTDPNEGAARKAGELLYSEELRFLNAHFAHTPTLPLDSISSHRPGFVGRLIVKFKRKLLSMLWDSMKGYFAAEREFQSNLVRYLNDVSKYVDARDAANFWELIRKIDYDVTKATQRIERISDEQTATVRSAERRMYTAIDEALGDLRNRVDELRANEAQALDRLLTTERVTEGLEGALARLSKARSSQANGVTPQEESAPFDIPDQSYLLLENRYRGSDEEIAARLRDYVELFKGASKPICDLGAGRGELVNLLEQAGVPSYGIDLDQAMVAAAVDLNIDVRVGEGLDHLSSLPDASIGGVIAIQVVEHLSRSDLERLCELCSQKVMPGGLVVFETINPKSVLALSSNFFRDPTHVWPVHPDTLGYLLSLNGLSVEEVRGRSPVPQEARLKEVPVEPFMTPRWAYTVSLLNRNLRQLNELLYGDQDYCVIARVRS